MTTKQLCLFGYLMLLFPLVSTNAQSGGGCPEFDGAWNYDLPDARGFWFAKGDRYLWIIIPKERMQFSGQEPTLEEKATAFREVTVSTGTWECTGKQGTVTHLYTKNPALKGQSFNFDYELNGNEVVAWPLSAEGTRAEGLKSHKIGDFNGKSCGLPHGFMEYDLPDMYGISVATESHFAWVLVGKEFWDKGAIPNTAEAQAEAFDNLIIATGTYSCDKNGRFEWNQHHALNPGAEGVSFPTHNEMEGDIVRYWILDAEGNRTEPGGRARRLK